MGKWKFKSLNELWEEVKKAREEARREALDFRMPFIWSRGLILSTRDKKGDQCSPWPEAEGCTWKNMREIKGLVKRIEEGQFKDVEEIYISGGFDTADSMQDYRDGNYEPWISSWSVTVWLKNEENSENCTSESAS